MKSLVNAFARSHHVYESGYGRRPRVLVIAAGGGMALEIYNVSNF